MMPLALDATLAAWMHTLSPWVWRFSPDFGVRWYGVSYALGFIGAWIILRALAVRGLIRIPAERVTDAVLLWVGGVVIGGRLGYVAFYKPHLLWTFTADVPWWGVLQLHKGGMASHGGIIGVVIASFMIARGFKDEHGVRHGVCPPLHVMDIAAVLCPLGLMLGRLANFINGELLGAIVAMPGQPAPWWAVKFPQEITGDHAPDLTAEQTARLAALARGVALPSDDTMEAALHRVLERVQQGSVEVRTQLEPLLAARHPSQLYQAAAEGLAVGAVVWLVWRKPRRAGVVAMWFLVSYGVLRVVTEIWRLPDADIGVQRILGLSRGQWLSVAMVAAGAIGLWLISKRGRPERFGGWGVARSDAAA
ncbi:MAG: prolipoprotein diacylglyceryl transferase [Planctomycetota bacterium]|nr:prolipoprotein diacylglyceryl transferase [Planctomycetota bacterium]